MKNNTLSIVAICLLAGYLFFPTSKALIARFSLRVEYA
jgi:hypothetical protein